MERIEFWDVLTLTQQHISKYYAAALTDENKREDLKHYIEKFILDGGTITPANSNQTTTTTSESTNEPSNTTKPTDSSTTTQSSGTTQPTTNTTQTTNTTEEPDENASPISDFEYKVNEDNGITITKYIGDDENVVIPSKIDGRNVTEIGDMSFMHLDIVSVKIPNTVTVVSAGAFSACKDLSNVVLPSALKKIGHRAFLKCTALKQINIPRSVNEWGSEVFGLSGLETVEFENGLKTIGEGAFTYTNLKSIVLPSSVKTIEARAFYGSKLETVRLNEGLLTIEIEAFGGQTLLKEFFVPTTVTNVTERAFYGSDSIEKVIFLGDAPASYLDFEERGPFVSSRVFYTVYYHAESDGFTWPYWNGYQTAVIGESTRAIPEFNDFQYSENEDGSITIHKYIGTAESVVIPETIDGKNVTVVDACAFESIENLLSVTFPDTVVDIGAKIFYGCSNLAIVNLSGNLKVIGGCAFKYCKTLASIDLPSTLQSIGESAFSYCEQLKHVTVPGSMVELQKNVFQGAGLETVSFEEGLEMIGKSAFAGTSLKEIVLPQSLIVISNGAFSFCALEKVTLNNGLITIGDLAFCSNEKLMEVIIPNTVENITELAFDSCSNLDRIKFEGNAPIEWKKEYNEPGSIYESEGIDCVIYYHAGANGFTSPIWNGYQTEIW